MTSEPISTLGEGRHAASPQDKTIEVPPTSFHFDDRARLASYRRSAPRPPAAPAGALIALVVGLSVVYAEWGLYPQTYQGQSDANWALGFMILSTAGALRILMGNPGRHLASGVAILVSGLGFLVRALLITRDHSDIYAFEIICGTLLVLAAVMTLLSPALTPEPSPGPDPWG